MNIIGREKELQILTRIANSKNAEFVAIYGRRRIGKTFLIREYFNRSQENQFFFAYSAVQEGSIADELARFQNTIEAQFFGGLRLPAISSFEEAFSLLAQAVQDYLKKNPKAERVVIFIDELPWMAKPRSRVLNAIDSVWNSQLALIPKVKLLVCGSAASWMIKNLVKATGGLHNRLTAVIPLAPLTLDETRAFLEARGLDLTLPSILDLYMAVGGIPHYLMQVERGRSVDSNIAAMCLERSGFLRDEFNQLFRSLFTNYEECEKIVRLLSNAPKGLTLDQIASGVSGSKGGRLRQRLRELEEAGFVHEFVPLNRSKKNSWFRLVDEYCVFYLKWIEPAPKGVFNGDGLAYWQSKRDTPSYAAWSGNAFENLCLKHSRQIRAELELSTAAIPSTWRYAPKILKTKKNMKLEIKGAQIDLLFDAPREITICEIKHSNKPYVVDKKFTIEFLGRIDIFKEKTLTKKQILRVLISTHGTKPSVWLDEAIDRVIDAKALFKKV